VTGPFFVGTAIGGIDEFTKLAFVRFEFTEGDDINRDIVLFELLARLGESLGLGGHGRPDKEHNPLTPILVGPMLEGETR
jgi:hypothetical protein